MVVRDAEALRERVIVSANEALQEGGWMEDAVSTAGDGDTAATRGGQRGKERGVRLKSSNLQSYICNVLPL